MGKLEDKGPFYDEILCCFALLTVAENLRVGVKSRRSCVVMARCCGIGRAVMVSTGRLSRNCVHGGASYI